LVGHGDAFVVRDPWGIRPAHYYSDDEIVVVASERAVIQTVMDIGFDEVKEVSPGEALIIKKDGRREEFNHKKVLTGIKKACEKRAISINLIEETVDAIERDLRQINHREIPSKIVGEKIIEALKQIDGVAYVRFASVYREFKDVADFIQELKGLIPKECLPIEFDEISDKADDRS
jgi:transcriptional repressor NrdR